MPWQAVGHSFVAGVTETGIFGSELHSKMLLDGLHTVQSEKLLRLGSGERLPHLPRQRSGCSWEGFGLLQVRTQLFWLDRVKSICVEDSSSIFAVMYGEIQSAGRPRPRHPIFLQILSTGFTFPSMRGILDTLYRIYVGGRHTGWSMGCLHYGTCEASVRFLNGNSIDWDGEDGRFCCHCEINHDCLSEISLTLLNAPDDRELKVEMDYRLPVLAVGKLFTAVHWTGWRWDAAQVRRIITLPAEAEWKVPRYLKSWMK